MEFDIIMKRFANSIISYFMFYILIFGKNVYRKFFYIKKNAFFFRLTICVKTNCISTKTYLGKKTEEIGINLKQDKRRRGRINNFLSTTPKIHT